MKRWLPISIALAFVASAVGAQESGDSGTPPPPSTEVAESAAGAEDPSESAVEPPAESTPSDSIREQRSYVVDTRYEKRFLPDVTERVMEVFQSSGIRKPYISYRSSDGPAPMAA